MVPSGPGVPDLTRLIIPNKCPGKKPGTIGVIAISSLILVYLLNKDPGMQSSQ